MPVIDEELDKLPAICVLKDHYGAFVYANRHMGQWFEEPSGGFSGKTDYHVMSDEDAAVIRDHDKHVMSTGEQLQAIEYVHADGVRTGYYVTKFRLSSARRRFLGVIGIPLPKGAEEETVRWANEWLSENLDFVKTRLKALLKQPELMLS
ncbi:MAG TPA: PAS domain-containing protein [Candidatus Obscuribacter sp.]|nr:PAS domain-containing protein [Candidatus Obscuribacter sp.]HND68719.1 PAS domain-containing protein [Candidatus Obscuribacter sp.]